MTTCTNYHSSFSRQPLTYHLLGDNPQNVEELPLPRAVKSTVHLPSNALHDLKIKQNTFPKALSVVSANPANEGSTPQIKDDVDGRADEDNKDKANIKRQLP